MNANQSQSAVFEVGEAGFKSEVLKSKQPVLVEFSASWSRPCHIVDSVLEEVAAACAGRVKVVRVNADDNPELSLWYEVQSIPTLLYFVDGRVRARLVGTVSKAAILAKLEGVANGEEAATSSPTTDKKP